MTFICQHCGKESMVLGSETSGAFEAFWKAYPKKKSKGQAEKAWKKMSPNLHGKIMVAVETHKQSADWLKDGGKFIPYPASWLNAKGWEDEIVWVDLPHGQTITNESVWQGALDSLCRDWSPDQFDSSEKERQFVANQLRRARSHVGCQDIRNYLGRIKHGTPREWEALLKGME